MKSEKFLKVKSEKIFECEKRKVKQEKLTEKQKAKSLILKTVSTKLKRKFYDFAFQLCIGGFRGWSAHSRFE